jgi:hypothetical protein
MFEEDLQRLEGTIDSSQQVCMPGCASVLVCISDHPPGLRLVCLGALCNQTVAIAGTTLGGALLVVLQPQHCMCTTQPKQAPT